MRRSGANIGGERLTGSCAAKRRYATIFVLDLLLFFYYYVHNSIISITYWLLRTLRYCLRSPQIFFIICILLLPTGYVFCYRLHCLPPLAALWNQPPQQAAGLFLFLNHHCWLGANVGGKRLIADSNNVPRV